LRFCISSRLLVKSSEPPVVRVGRKIDKGEQSIAVAVHGPLIVDDVELLIRAAIDGAGLAFILEAHAAPHLASGALVRVLEDWCPPFAGYFLYYPSRRQQPAALTALIETLRL
jgi:DNA-binding transcriptional LysR family regulator